jgi:hypothetical protein
MNAPNKQFSLPRVSSKDQLPIAKGETRGALDPLLCRFDMATYREIVNRLRGAGYQILPVSAMPGTPNPNGKAAYFRHDVDLFLEGVLPMAEAEQKMRIRATYLIPLTLPFNVMFAENMKIIRQLVAWRHEIGLHYDLRQYPTDESACLQRLRWEAELLSSITQQKVRLIAQHEPFRGLPDPFLQCDEFLNPRDPRLADGLLYVSDSCRAWRDDSLLRCFSKAEAPRKLLLLIHPGLWLDGRVLTYAEYLEKVLAQRASDQVRRYFVEYCVGVARIHPAVKAYEARLREGGLLTNTEGEPR